MPKSETPSEHAEQVAVVKWLRATHPDALFYAVPNGGFRFRRTAILLALEGVVSGVPDLCIAEPRNGFHGLYIEMKRVKDGRVSKTQAEFGEALIKRGYCFKICFGAEDAIATIKEYFHVSKPARVRKAKS